MLEEEWHWGWALSVSNLPLLPLCFLCFLFEIEDVIFKFSVPTVYLANPISPSGFISHCWSWHFIITTEKQLICLL